MPRTALCDRLGIRHPIFGFSHSLDVAVAIAQAGGFPVLGLAREMPEEIPHLLAEAERRLGAMPLGHRPDAALAGAEGRQPGGPAGGAAR